MLSPRRHSDPPTITGQLIDDRFEILERLGDGGMGVVYMARQKPFDRLVAIKMLHPELSRDPTWVERFYTEARACSRLKHPNTISMFDFGQTGSGELFLAMEYVGGHSLRRVLAHGPLAPLRVLSILIQCSGSLVEAHAQGIVHRDIKPENVLLLDLPDGEEHVKLLDFSVAKLLDEAHHTLLGRVFGTPSYMSPEQACGRAVDGRSDLYSLGVLAFEMLVGRPPFRDPDSIMVRIMHASSPLPPMSPDVPASIQAIVRRCLAKDPADRYATALDMMRHCQAVLAQLAGTAQPLLADADAPTLLEDPTQFEELPLGADPVRVVALTASPRDNTVRIDARLPILVWFALAIGAIAIAAGAYQVWLEIVR